jgi:hypothetical protein
MRGTTLKFLTISHCLEPGERVEADNGYVGHADKIKCPNNDCKPVENLGMQGTARSCHDMLNGCLNDWGILEKVYHHYEYSYTEYLCCDSAFAHKKEFSILNSLRGFWRSLVQRSHSFFFSSSAKLKT